MKETTRPVSRKYDYDQFRRDYDYGYSENEFLFDFLHDQEMLRCLEISELTDILKKCLGPANIAVEDTEVVVMESGHIWLLSDGKKIFSLRKYRKTLRLYDNDEYKVTYVERPSMKQISVWNDIAYKTLTARSNLEKWAVERSQRTSILAKEREEAMEVAELDQYRIVAEAHMEKLSVLIERGFDNIKNGVNAVTNRDLIQAIQAHNRINQDLINRGKDAQSGDNYLMMIINSGAMDMVKPPGAHPATVIEGEYKELPESSGGEDQS